MMKRETLSYCGLNRKVKKTKLKKGTKYLHFQFFEASKSDYRTSVKSRATFLRASRSIHRDSADL